MIRAGMNTTLCPEAVAFFARCDSTYPFPVKCSLSDIILAMQNTDLASGTSYWDACQAIWIRSLASPHDSRLNLKGTDYPLTDVGSPTHTAGEGIKYSGSGQYTRTGVTPAAISSSRVGMTGAYLRLNLAQNSKYTFGVTDGTNTSFIEEKRTDNTTLAAINRTSGFATVVGSEGRGAVTVFRRDDDTIRAIRRQGSAATATATGTNPPNAEIYLAGFNNNGTLDSGFESANQIAAAWVSCGVVWTDDEVRNWHGVIEEFLFNFGGSAVAWNS